MHKPLDGGGTNMYETIIIIHLGVAPGEGAELGILIFKYYWALEEILDLICLQIYCLLITVCVH